ncbi:hypothetical protein C8R44DRAFT_748085 [Mycena epipterygia]|nr:hypothetical protein C8R44DRAFT_748085 [Mycena epipterygia]
MLIPSRSEFSGLQQHPRHEFNQQQVCMPGSNIHIVTDIDPRSDSTSQPEFGTLAIKPQRHTSTRSRGNVHLQIKITLPRGTTFYVILLLAVDPHSSPIYSPRCRQNSKFNIPTHFCTLSETTCTLAKQKQKYKSPPDADSKNAAPDIRELNQANLNQSNAGASMCTDPHL